jgi:hypothetical protein
MGESRRSFVARFFRRLRNGWETPAGQPQPARGLQCRPTLVEFEPRLVLVTPNPVDLGIPSAEVHIPASGYFAVSTEKVVAVDAATGAGRWDWQGSSLHPWLSPGCPRPWLSLGTLTSAVRAGP